MRAKVEAKANAVADALCLPRRRFRRRRRPHAQARRLSRARARRRARARVRAVASDEGFSGASHSYGYGNVHVGASGRVVGRGCYTLTAPSPCGTVIMEIFYNDIYWTAGRTGHRSVTSLSGASPSVLMWQSTRLSSVLLHSSFAAREPCSRLGRIYILLRPRLAVFEVKHSV